MCTVACVIGREDVVGEEPVRVVVDLDVGENRAESGATLSTAGSVPPAATVSMGVVAVEVGVASELDPPPPQLASARTSGSEEKRTDKHVRRQLSRLRKKPLRLLLRQVSPAIADLQLIPPPLHVLP
jgi:hypothetical protein